MALPVPSTVVVVGGSLGGLSVGTILKRLGHHVRILEVSLLLIFISHPSSSVRMNSIEKFHGQSISL